MKNIFTQLPIFSQIARNQFNTQTTQSNTNQIFTQLYKYIA
ncbi:hypothetical protein MCERE19_04393 [Spirosomataceae bacterium]|jgi:hypothetical protein